MPSKMANAGGKTAIIDLNLVLRPHGKSAKSVSKSLESIKDPELYAGLFAQGQGGYASGCYPSWESFISVQNQLVNNTKLRLTSITTNEATPDTPYFIGTWLEIDRPSSLYPTSDWNDLTSLNQQYSSGMHLADLDIRKSNDQGLVYTGTWNSPASNPKQTLLHDLTWNDLISRWTTISGQGQRLKRLSAYTVGSEIAGFQTLYAALFEPGSGAYYLKQETDWTTFINFYDSVKDSTQLVDFKVYNESFTGIRKYIGVWQQTSVPHTFIFNKDFTTFFQLRDSMASQQSLYLQKITRFINPLGPSPTPKWDYYFASSFTETMGFAYVALKDGVAITSGFKGRSRSAKDPTESYWNVQTRSCLASVSKSITAVALMKLFADRNLSVDQPFYPLVKDQIPVVADGVDTVTVRNLLEMGSGMPIDNTLVFEENGSRISIWAFLRNFLKNTTVDQSKRGHPEIYQYSNTSYTILQAVIDCVTGHGGEWPDYYPTYVKNTVLTPMGIKTNIFNDTPDPEATATLSYTDMYDKEPGQYWDKFDAVAAGGWHSNAQELAKFMTGVRQNKVLDQATTDAMMIGTLGWATWDGAWGRYYHHNGGLGNGTRSLHTGNIRFTYGWDCVILINSGLKGGAGIEPIGYMVGAFDSAP